MKIAEVQPIAKMESGKAPVFLNGSSADIT
jgi:hypothetical protein